MKALWNYADIKEPEFRYGRPDMYIRGMEWLEEVCSVVEDWGCRTTCAKKFLKQAKYIGIDGSASPFTDKVVDLREYTSEVEGIFMRGVIEHNYDWKAVLDNALKSFTKRMALVIFTPFGPETKNIARPEAFVPDLSFRKEDLLNRMKGLRVREENVTINSEYGAETIFYLER